MRLNEHIPDTNPPHSTDVQSLLKGLLDSATESLAVDLHSDPLERPDRIIDHFFEKYYVKPNNTKMGSSLLLTHGR